MRDKREVKISIGLLRLRWLQSLKTFGDESQGLIVDSQKKYVRTAWREILREVKGRDFNALEKEEEEQKKKWGLMLVQCFVTSVTWKYSQFVFLDIICLNLEVFNWGQVCVEMVRQMCSQLILTIEGDHPDSFVGNTLHRCYLFNACVCVCVSGLHSW